MVIRRLIAWVIKYYATFWLCSADFLEQQRLQIWKNNLVFDYRIQKCSEFSCKCFRIVAIFSFSFTLVYLMYKNMEILMLPFTLVTSERIWFYSKDFLDIQVSGTVLKTIKFLICPNPGSHWMNSLSWYISFWAPFRICIGLCALQHPWWKSMAQ